MILVNFPGSWNAIYTPFTHAMEGIQIADLVFPIFLWTVGYSIQLSLQKRITQSNIDLLTHVTLRFLLLIFCGLVLSFFPNGNWEDFRIPGVLQRIGFCYIIIMILFRFFDFKSAMVVSVTLPITLALLNRFLVYGETGPILSIDPPAIEFTLGARLDQFIFGKHIWKESKVYDPEGILTSFCSLLTVVLGLFSYHLESKYKKRYVGLFIGLFYLILGFLLSFVFPVSKTNWSLSYIFITASFVQFMYLFFCMSASEAGPNYLKNIFCLLFGEIGKHALFIFFMTGILARTKFFGVLRTYIFQNLTNLTQNKWLASFLFSLIVYLGILVITFLIKRTLMQMRSFRFSSTKRNS